MSVGSLNEYHRKNGQKEKEISIAAKLVCICAIKVI